MRHFGDLRSIFAAKPSAQGWARIVALIDQAAVEQTRELIPYMLTHLERWPATLLEAPLDWISRAIDGEPVPQLRLIKTFEASLLSPHELIELTARGLLDGVERLSLRGCELTAQDIQRWLDVAQELRPQALDLSELRLSDTALRALVEHPMADALKTLTIERHALSVRGVQYLANSPSLRGLEQLGLGHALLDHDQASELSHAVHLPALKTLSLSGVKFGAYAPAKLFQGGALMKQLEHLDLSGASMPWHNYVDLTTRELPQLKSLNLSNAFGSWNLDAPPIKLKASMLPHLHTLTLRGMRYYSDVILQAINATQPRAISWGYFKALRTLDLRDNPIGLDGILHLSQEGDFTQLHTLELDDERISAQWARMLADSLVLPSRVKGYWESVADMLETHTQRSNR